MDRINSNVDRVGHSSVQPWSMGEYFPATIARIEDYRSTMNRDEQRAMRGAIGYADEARWLAGASLESRLECVSYELTVGTFVEVYASREDAEMVARWACSGGRIIPEHYAQLVPGAGKSMAAFGVADVAQRARVAGAI